MCVYTVDWINPYLPLCEECEFDLCLHHTTRTSRRGEEGYILSLSRVQLDHHHLHHTETHTEPFDSFSTLFHWWRRNVKVNTSVCLRITCTRWWCRWCRWCFNSSASVLTLYEWNTSRVYGVNLWFQSVFFLFFFLSIFLLFRWWWSLLWSHWMITLASCKWPGAHITVSCWPPEMKVALVMVNCVWVHSVKVYTLLSLNASTNCTQK